ncbi:MAG: 4Fe-4S binding protein [Spirochaetaceae bacterium]|nr:4Fe-4S binding protein [Spirochaetaceae bacterium]RKX79319.1 MAG: 4Fe-4S ferredoxin [Spirochaetota bacterium]RKX86285.1 MAG: 4Fe-4S ferredoxin [Spirochaetota bacterium]RKX92966.1 MAG: 4Fe-4S ferredoxin [Spirochaetota bacterium]
MKKNKTTTALQWLTGLISIGVFVFLLLNHKLQLWIVVFGVSAILSTLLGRFYCSWICPMNTSFKIIDSVYRKLGIKRLKAPEFLSNRFVRIGVLVLFVAAMVLFKRFGIKLNALLYLTIFSVLLTLIFQETFWHRHLCPFGTILSFTSRKALYSMKINEEECIECGKCQEVCPTGSILTLENGKRRNTSHECLLCGKCTEVCPVSVCQLEW